MDNYVSNLSAEMLKRAKDEFGEDEQLRESSLIAIRDWIKKQPHLVSTMNTDATHLIKFLRACKFSLDKTKHKLDFLSTLKNALPEFFIKWDPMASVNQTALNCGGYLPLIGYDHLGHQVCVIRPGAHDPNKIKFEYLLKANLMVSKILWEEDEQMSITGQILIIDLKGFGFDHFAQITLSMASKMKALMDAFPNRMKSFHFINTPTSFSSLNPLINIIFNKEKMMKRIITHGNNLESLQKVIPKDVLPKDYGGNGMSIRKLTKYWKKKAEENRDFLMKYEKMDKADESKRSSGQPKTSAELFGIEGSFRKLNLD